jgi:hypothetical protein
VPNRPRQTGRKIRMSWRHFHHLCHSPTYHLPSALCSGCNRPESSLPPPTLGPSSPIASQAGWCGDWGATGCENPVNRTSCRQVSGRPVVRAAPQSRSEVGGKTEFTIHALDGEHIIHLHLVPSITTQHVLCLLFCACRTASLSLTTPRVPRHLQDPPGCIASANCVYTMHVQSKHVSAHPSHVAASVQS